MIHQNLIAGEWRPATDASLNLNPSNTADVVGEYARGSARDVADAAEAAARALPGWRDAGPQARSDLLDRVGQALLDRKDEIGRLLAREEGKTLPEAVGETARAGKVFKFFAGEALRNAGDPIESVRPGVDVTGTREPVGVVGLITP